MNDKRFLKVKRVGEERYFADDGEFEQFIIKQGGTADEDYGELKNMGLSENHLNLIFDINSDRIVFGGFLWKVTRGYFGYNIGYGNRARICILAEQSARDMTLNDQLQAAGYLPQDDSR